MGRPTKDYSHLFGLRFGKLVVLGMGPKVRAGAGLLCKCDCGVERSIRPNDLETGGAISCGCARRPSLSLAGQVFGRLTVIKREGRKSKTNRTGRWLSQCSCGNQKTVSSSSLVTGHTQSCGCLHKEKLKAKLYIDLTGRVFGLLTAVRPTGKYHRRSEMWVCVCLCTQRSLHVEGRALRSGAIWSCGCAESQYGRSTRTRRILLDESAENRVEALPCS
jgi:hypothetical protein